MLGRAQRLKTDQCTYTYQDTGVVAGSTYCYPATTVLSSSTGPVEPAITAGTWQATIPIFTPAAVQAPPRSDWNGSET